MDLLDLSYDGTTTEGLLIGGLGQLHDGIVGDHNFKTDIGYGKGKRGKTLVGMEREGQGGRGGQGWEASDRERHVW